MDELLPIKKLSQTQIRIREALKNAPPLTITKKTTIDDFIVFEGQKTSEESLFDRYLRHKKINGSENKNSVHKWTELKDIMLEELEIKRMDSLKIKQINENLENEEFDEKEDNLETILNKEIDNNCRQNSELEESDDSSNVTDEEVEDQELDEYNEEEEESERELNPFLDEEAEDDREDRDQMDESLESDSNDSNDSFNQIISEQKERSFTEEEYNEKNGLNDSALNSSFNSLEESNERLCATQKIALSPFITQRPKPRFTSNEGFPELISNLQSNNEEFNSQSLLDLCSGNFSQNDEKVLTQSEIDLENSHKSDSENEFNDRYSVLSKDEEEDEEVLSGSKKVGKVFNIESEDEDNDMDLRTNKDMIPLKSFNESDDEEINIEDEVETEGEEIEGTEEEEPQNVNSFFDNEAELSGSEVSSDEEDNDDDTQDMEEEELEDLPSESEIEDQNKRYFNKQILDEEKRNIMIWKERLFEDGDLHDDGRQRQKKFRWNFTTDNNFVNDYINEDSDDNYMDSDEDGKTETPTLKMFDPKSEIEANKKSDKFKTTLSLKSAKKICSDSKNVNSISAFVVRDQRLNTIMSFKSKRILDSKNSFKSNKKLKTSNKNTKISIFDLLNN